jgi:hypothetical protein
VSRRSGSSAARIAAALIAVLAWTGLALLLMRRLARGDIGLARALWANARFFTDVGNLLVALEFTALALAPRLVTARVFGMALSSMLMAAIVFYGLLDGWAALAYGGPGGVIAHAIVPAAVLLYWLAFPPAGPMRTRDIALWASFPLAYCAYAITRGLSDGRYPYYFLDVNRLGAKVAIYIVGILLLFCIIGVGVVAIDGWRKRGRSISR